MKIEMGKQYRTRDGREVRIYAVDGYETVPVHGAIKQEAGWVQVGWRADGNWSGYGSGNAADLIEVKPRIKRKLWVNVYSDGRTGQLFKEKAEADRYSVCGRIACVEIDIDVEEGHGL